jgi:hypothetical protein
VQRKKEKGFRIWDLGFEKLKSKILNIVKEDLKHKASNKKPRILSSSVKFGCVK